MCARPNLCPSPMFKNVWGCLGTCAKYSNQANAVSWLTAGKQSFGSYLFWYLHSEVFVFFTYFPPLVSATEEPNLGLKPRCTHRISLLKNNHETQFPLPPWMLFPLVCGQDTVQLEVSLNSCWTPLTRSNRCDLLTGRVGKQMQYKWQYEDRVTVISDVTPWVTGKLLWPRWWQ